LNENLIELQFDYCYNQPIELNEQLEIFKIYKYNNKLNKFINSLKYLKKDLVDDYIIYYLK